MVKNVYLFHCHVRRANGEYPVGKIPDTLRQIIAQNILHCRMEKFPGRGGGKKCAESFGVSPQQWSPWERGMRTPDELRLAQLAEFFGVTVEWLRRDHTQSEPQTAKSEKSHTERPVPDAAASLGPSSPELLSYLYQNRMKAVYRVEVMVTGMHLVPIQPA